MIISVLPPLSLTGRRESFGGWGGLSSQPLSTWQAVIDLISVEYLPVFRLAFRIPIKFTSSQVPRLCHKRKQSLRSKKIWIRRVFQSSDIKPLVRKSACWPFHPSLELYSYPPTPMEPGRSSVPSLQPLVLNPMAQEVLEARNASARYLPNHYNCDSATAALKSCITNLKTFFLLEIIVVQISNQWTQQHHCALGL